MSASTGEGQGLAKVVEELLALLFQGDHVPDMVRVVVVLASGVFLLLSLLLNIIVMVNICYMKRIQVGSGLVLYFFFFIVQKCPLYWTISKRKIFVLENFLNS